jgi:hypothetical protein
MSKKFTHTCLFLAILSFGCLNGSQSNANAVDSFLQPISADSDWLSKSHIMSAQNYGTGHVHLVEYLNRGTDGNPSAGLAFIVLANKNNLFKVIGLMAPPVVKLTPEDELVLVDSNEESLRNKVKTFAVKERRLDSSLTRVRRLGHFSIIELAELFPNPEENTGVLGRRSIRLAVDFVTRKTAFFDGAVEMLDMTPDRIKNIGAREQLFEPKKQFTKKEISVLLNEYVWFDINQSALQVPPQDWQSFDELAKKYEAFSLLEWIASSHVR